MSDKKKSRSLERLNGLSQTEQIEAVLKDGRTRSDLFVYDVSDYHREGVQEMFYVSGKPYEAPDASVVDPRDWLPSVPLHDLGYVKVLSTGQKISLIPFQKPQTRRIGLLFYKDLTEKVLLCLM